MQLENGKTYKITNAKGGTVLDLSGGQDQSPITGYNFSGGDNQKWVAEQQDQNWRFKNPATGLFIGYSGDANNNTPVKAMKNPTIWDVRPDQENPDTMRACVAGTDYCLDLSGHGNSNPGTPVTLWKKWGGANQTWRFEQV
ncbi:hypothetical protein V8D89_000909 [Ganoderma adspersum]